MYRSGYILILALLGAAQLVAQSRVAQTAPSTAPAAQLSWQTDYAQALAGARRQNKPVLVRAGAVWCRWCTELDREIAKPEIQKTLADWVLVYVDIDRSPKDADSLAIGPVPALRMLSPSGRLQASHDGYLPAHELAAWLGNSRGLMMRALPAPATQPETAAETIERLIHDLGRRDPAVREAAIRRLLLVPRQAVGPVVKALADGDLATRLSAFEVLNEWHAPIDGLDPWQPSTMVDDRLVVLRDWASRPAAIVTSQPMALTDVQLAGISRDIARLLSDEVSPAECDAIRERLARYGALLLPQVYDAIKSAVSDRARERLTALRYRLVARDELVFAWPGGIERLSAMELDTRHRAADDLVQRAGSADEALLLELFSDPDPLVREISLRALRKVSGNKASEALAHLLSDPEPNVRAAVLKQLAESPSPAMMPKIAEYVTVEQDADLVVHAVRVLRASPGDDAARALIALVKHPNWQVRAEATEALGDRFANTSAVSAKTSKRIKQALVTLLDDSDGFVVGAAVKALRNFGTVSVEPMARAADKHPELAAEVLEAFTENPDADVEVRRQLRRFCKHPEPAVRALAIGSLCKIASIDAADELDAALRDDSSRVRIAAAAALLRVLDNQRPSLDDELFIHPVPQRSGGFFETLLSLSLPARPASRPASQPEATTASQPEDTNSAASTQRSATSAPASAPADPRSQVARSDRWLQQFRAGTDRPRSLDKLQPALKAMLVADAPEEQAAAAVVLVAFGREGEAMPVMLAALRQRPELAATLAGALPWLPGKKRIELFDALTAVKPSPTDLYVITQSMAVWADPAVAESVWAQLDDAGVVPETASHLYDSLRRLYFGDYGYNASNAAPAVRERAITDMSRHAQQGSELKRLVALTLLASVSPKDAVTLAARVADDPEAGESLRTDAFQIQLLCVSKSEARKLVADAMTSDNRARRGLAVRYLAEGAGALRALRSGALNLYVPNAPIENEFLQTGQPIKVGPATDLAPELLRPLLGNSDERVAAEVGYLLATLKDSAGLDRLIRYWREKVHEEQVICRLAYRAIVALQDDSQVPVLEEIYHSLPQHDYSMREFYWTIRTMPGPNAAKLRKQMRDEVGMDNLR